MVALQAISDSRRRVRKSQKQSLGSRLRAFRKSGGLTQEEIARRAHLTSKFISEIENGHSNPSVAVLTRIVEHGLGVTMSAFFGTDMPDESRSDLERLRSLFAAQSAVMRRRALRVLKALCDE